MRIGGNNWLSAVRTSHDDFNAEAGEPRFTDA
jgi:hypothetical protein